MNKEDVRELVEEALENIVSKKKVDMGLIKLELRTDGDSVWAVGSNSGLYQDIVNDLSDFEQHEISDALDELKDKFIKFQELFVASIEQI